MKPFNPHSGQRLRHLCAPPNHLVKDCPHRLDVQRLTAEQQEELIEDLMALKDAVTEEEVGSSPEEDFV